MTWTREKVEILKREWANGVSAADIGAKLGFSRNAIIGKRDRLGLPKRAATSRNRSSKRRAKRVRKSPWRNHPPGDILDLEQGWIVREPTTTLIDVGKNDCRYIFGDPNGCDTPMCGHKTVPNTSWCAFHLDIISGVEDNG